MGDVPVLSGLLDGLQAWQDQVVEDKIIGHGLRSSRGYGALVPGLDLLSMLMPQDAANAADAQGLTGKDWVDATYKDAPWQRFITTAAMDPTNFVGAGIPAKALKVAGAGSKLAPALKALDFVDKAPGRVTGPVFDAVGSRVGQAANAGAAAVLPAFQRFGAAHPNLANGWNKTMSGWREQALMSPGYHVRNATENVIRAALEGDTKTARETVKGMFTGRNHFDDFAQHHGFGPTVTTQVAGDPTMMGKGSVFRDIPGGLGKPVAALSEANRRFATHVEGQARKAAFATQYEKSLQSGATQAEAIADGVDYANKLFYDYGRNTPVDEVGKNLFAFHKFAVNNIPAQFRKAGEAPGILNVPSDYYRVSDEYNQDHGLTGRFHGELPIGDGGAHINPFKLWSVGELVGNATKDPTQSDQDESIVGRTANTLRDTGLGINPFIDAILTITGQHGRSFAPGFLRVAQPANGILSSLTNTPQDIEGWPKDRLGDVQEMLTGQRPFPYQEYLLRKRQAELGAWGQDKAGAGSDVGDTMAAEGVAGFLGVPGLKFLSPEERRIRQNQALATAYRLAGNTQAARSNPTSGVYANVDPRTEQIKNFNQLTPAEQSRLLRDPEVRDELLKELSRQTHSQAPRVQDRRLNPFGR